MSFISYAQNFEDVMLWRALKHVDKGVYVDVGAHHPVIDSVSKAFYERGWRGIHIEPMPEYAELLRQDRPDEIVLELALSDTDGVVELNVIPGTGLSTVLTTVQVCEKVNPVRLQIPSLTLKSALISLLDKELHWLKIDVEGFEENVLRGWDSQILRPWIMVIEATLPNSSVTNHESWEFMLLEANYQFAYFDGLNRFYVAKEHSELMGAFSCPPNIFDCFDRYNVIFYQKLLAQSQAREASLFTQLEGLSRDFSLLCGSKLFRILRYRYKLVALRKTVLNYAKRLLSKDFYTPENLRRVVKKIVRKSSASSFVANLTRHKKITSNEANKKSNGRKKIIIDLMPLLPGGENGGAKPIVLELIQCMAKIAQDKDFVLLTPERVYQELAYLDATNVQRVCVTNSSFSLSRDNLAGDLLFCPFTYSSYADKSIPTVSIIYDLQYLCYPQFFKRDEVEQRHRNFIESCRYSDRLICISDYVRETVIKNSPNFSPKDIHSIPCVIPLKSHLATSRELKLDYLVQHDLVAGRYLLYPANFWLHKNHEVLLMAFAMYCARYESDLKLALTGHPTARSQWLQEAVKKMNLDKKVHFLGYVDNESLMALMLNCRAFIFPSLYEGFGVPVLEAMLCEKPVLCSNVTALPEVVKEAALLFDPRKPQEIVDAITKIESSDLLRENLIEKGQSHMAAFPDTEQISKRYLNVFAELLQEEEYA
ncbi:MAG TPA: FkbM family methyltransferase [Coxiellaceae bacterium]|nr:FkbM family methyltransferase [Coxiellaceae bacterium]